MYVVVSCKKSVRKYNLKKGNHNKKETLIALQKSQLYCKKRNKLINAGKILTNA